MNEVERAGRFIYLTLVGNAGVTALVDERIYEHPAEPGSTWPLITFQCVSSPDVTANGGLRVLSRPLFLVRAIAKGGERPGAIADALDEALHDQQGMVGEDTYVAACFRESGLSFSEISDGIVYRHMGGHYRVDLHPI